MVTMALVRRNWQLVEKVLLVAMLRGSSSLQKPKENADSLPAAGRFLAVGRLFAKAQGKRNDNGQSFSTSW